MAVFVDDLLGEGVGVGVRSVSFFWGHGNNTQIDTAVFLIRRQERGKERSARGGREGGEWY